MKISILFPSQIIFISSWVFQRLSPVTIWWSLNTFPGSINQLNWYFCYHLESNKNPNQDEKMRYFDFYPLYRVGMRRGNTATICSPPSNWSHALQSSSALCSIIANYFDKIGIHGSISLSKTVSWTRCFQRENMFWRVSTIISSKHPRSPRYIDRQRYFSPVKLSVQAPLFVSQMTPFDVTFYFSQHSLKCYSDWIRTVEVVASDRWVRYTWIFWQLCCEEFAGSETVRVTPYFQKIAHILDYISYRFLVFEKYQSQNSTDIRLHQERWRRIDLASICTTDVILIESALHDDRYSREIHQYDSIDSSSDRLIWTKTMQSNSAGRNNALIERTHDFDGQSMIACWYGESHLDYSRFPQYQNQSLYGRRVSMIQLHPVSE